MPRGGAREGAGRKADAGEVRKRRTLRATDFEWEMHLAFDKILKYTNKDAAVAFINRYRII